LSRQPIDDLLFPINHGMLYDPGCDVLPPFVVHQVDRLGEAGFAIHLNSPDRGTD
jgi:NAD(P)H dehydrogenase (quinone)